jgi:hypothetical protein
MTEADIINTTGVFLILLAFFLLTTGRLTQNRSYHLLNLLGGGLACYGAILINAIPFVVLEGTWALVALYGILKTKRI